MKERSDNDMNEICPFLHLSFSHYLEPTWSASLTVMLKEIVAELCSKTSVVKLFAFTQSAEPSHLKNSGFWSLMSWIIIWTVVVELAR